MDALPPQAPPAIVSSAQQGMLDAVARLDAAQAWQNDLVLAMPSLPDVPTRAGKRDYLFQLADFWHDTATRRTAALRAHLAGVMRDEALLRSDDRTLEARAVEMATTFARSIDGRPAATLQAHALRIGEMPFAGAVVVTGGEDDPVVAFFPASGWENHADVRALLDAVETRVRQWQKDGYRPGGMALDDIDEDPSERIVSLEAMRNDPFLLLASSIVARQRERVEMAWGPFFDDTLPADERPLALDALRHAVRLDMLPDIRQILIAHERRLVHQVTEERLASASPAVAADWRRAMDAYAQLQRTSSQWTWLQLPDLDTFTGARIASRLKAHGIDRRVDEVFVDVYACVNCPQLPAVIAPYRYRFERTVSLLGLAYENTPGWDDHGFALVDDQRRPVGELSSDQIRELVRDVDAGASYAKLIRTTLADSMEGEMRRDLAAGALGIRLRMEAEEARLSSERSEATAAIAGQPLRSGYDWIDRVLDEPDGRVRAGDLRVRQVTYRGTPVAGVVVISSTSRHDERQVVYTPDAPDGVAWREFRDGGEVDRELLYNLSFQAYLLDRLPPDAATIQPNGQRAFFVSEATRLKRWVFGGLPAQNTTHTDEPFAGRTIEGHFLRALFDAEVDLRTTQVPLLARSSASADDDYFRVDPAKIARGFAHFIGRAPMAGWRFYDRVKARHAAEAFVEFTATYTAMLDFGLLYGLRPGLANAIIVRGAHETQKLRLARVDLVTPITLFEARFAVTCAKCVRSLANAHGLHQVDGQNLIAQGGRMYAVRYDASAQTWRLTRPGTLDANYTGPAVVHVGEGQWTYRTDVGLLGGAPPAGTTTLSVLREHRARIADVRDFTDAQLERLSSHLVAGKGTDAGARKLAWRKIQRDLLSATERQRWQAAVEWAREGPAAAPIPSEPARPPVRVGALPPPLAVPAPALSHVAVAVERAVWPRYVWHYTDDTAIAAMRAEGFRWLEQSAPRRGFPPGAYVTTLDPARNDLDQVAAWLSGRNAWTRRANRPDMTNRWLKLDLDALPPGYRLHRVTNVHESTYLIQPPALPGSGHAGNVPGALPAIPLRGVFIEEGSRAKP